MNKEVKDEIKNPLAKYYKQHTKYLVNRYKDDPAFRELCKQRAKQNYLKKKASPNYQEYRLKTIKSATAYNQRKKAEKMKKTELELDIENA